MGSFLISLASMRMNRLLLVMSVAAVCARAGTLAPIYGASGGTVTQVSVAALPTSLVGGWVLTAVRNGNGNLALTSWEDTGSAFVKLHSATAGAVSKVALAAPLSNVVVTAVVNGSGDLELISWQIASDGSLTRLSSLTAGPASTVSMDVVQNAPSVCTASRDVNGDLSVQVWNVSTGGIITLAASASGGPISTAAISSTVFSNQFFTAAKNSSGNLVVASWNYNGGGTIVQQGSNSAGAVKTVSTSFWNSDFNTYTDMATGVINGSGKLEMISWRVSESDGSITREGSANGDAGSQAVVAATGDGEAFSAIRDSSGNLSAYTWADAPVKIDNGYHTATAIASLAAIQSTYFGHVVTASRTSSGKLSMQVWQVF